MTAKDTLQNPNSVIANAATQSSVFGTSGAAGVLRRFTPPVPCTLCGLIAVIGLLLGAVCLAPAQAQSAVPAASAAKAEKVYKRGDHITLNFNAADIEAVARTMGVISGMNVVVDPRVKGQITLVSEKSVSPQVAMAQFLTSLRMQGFTMVESAGLFKVVPEADAKLQSAAVETNESAPKGAPGAQIATQIFKLNFESANNLVTILRPLISPNNTINANPVNNSLVITDYADNLRRIARIITALDVSNATDVEVIELKNAIAVDLAPLVTRLLESGGVAGAAPGGVADGGFKNTVIAEARSNSLLVRAANGARLAQIKSLVEKLDRASNQGNGEAGVLRVVSLKNADAPSWPPHCVLPWARAASARKPRLLRAARQARRAPRPPPRAARCRPMWPPTR